MYLNGYEITILLIVTSLFLSLVNKFIFTNKKCKDDAVCAYEFNGKLYPSKEKRDKAEAVKRRSDGIEHLFWMLDDASLRVPGIQGFGPRDLRLMATFIYDHMPELRQYIKGE